MFIYPHHEGLRAVSFRADEELLALVDAVAQRYGTNFSVITRTALANLITDVRRRKPETVRQLLIP